MIIPIYEIVGSPFITNGQAPLIFARIERAFKANKPVTLDFANITNVSVSSLQIFIGQLYGVFTRETIQRLLSVTGLDGQDMELMKRVVECAIKYFEDRRAEHDNNA